MMKPPSNRKQTWELVGITFGLCLITAVVAAAPSEGAQAFLRAALQKASSLFALPFSSPSSSSQTGSVDPPALKGDDLLLGTGSVEFIAPEPVKSIELNSNLSFKNSRGSLLAISGKDATPTPAPAETVTATEVVSVDPTATVFRATPSPTHETTPTATPVLSPTPTATLMGRYLALSEVEVTPGDNFTVVLTCNDLVGVAGGDFQIVFDMNLIDLFEVKKAEASEDFLLIARKTESGYSISMAAMSGIPTGGGVLLFFSGISSSSPTELISAPLSFANAKLYDESSRAIPISTHDGSVTIKVQGGSEDTQTTSNDSQGTETTFPTAHSESPTEVSPSVPPTPVEMEPSDPVETSPQQPILPPSIGGISSHDIPVPTTTSIPITQVADDAQGEILVTDLTGDGVVDCKDVFEFVKYWKSFTETKPNKLFVGREGWLER
jgi:hypothetical protein